MTSNDNGFDYATLDEETCAVIQACTREIQSRLLKTVEQMIAIGQQLQIVKNKLKHGQFQSWLLNEFNMNPRQARLLMQIARQFKTANFAVLEVAPSALYLLAEIKTPELARQEAINRAEKGEKITLRTAKEIVARHKANTAENHAPSSLDVEEIEADRAEYAIIDIPAVTVPDEPIPKSVPQLFKVGDRIRIIRRQHGTDDWTGSTATIWEVTTDGWLRVNVEGRDGVKFTLHPDWVELIQVIQEPTMTASNQTEAETVEPVEHQLHVRIPLEINGKTVQVAGVINEVEVQYTHEGRTGTIKVPANKVVFPKTDKG